MTGLEKALLDQIQHAVFILEPGSDLHPRYSAFNQFACRRLGKSEDEIIGLTALEVYPGRPGKIAFDQHCNAMQAAVERSYEILLPLEDGTRRIRTILTPVTDGRGHVARLIGSSSDVSGTQMVNEMRAGAETLSNEMEEFINLAAHDLRAPMRQVSAIADLLREDFKDLGDGKLELINVLEDVGTKAMSLIGDVLSHAQTTAVMEEVIEFEFSDLVMEIMGLLDPMNRCEVSIPDCLIVGDRTATQMVLRNLIDNAIKCAGNNHASDDEPRKLQLKISLRELEGLIEIGLQDNGVGFSETAIVFLNGGELRTSSGFGMLGVRRLISSRGGTLTATNSPDGTGALVLFSLPGRTEASSWENFRQLESAASTSF